MHVTCPNCNAAYYRLDVGEDKSKVLFTNPTLGKTLYAKRYTCKDCTHAWTEGEEGSSPKATEAEE